MSLLYICFVLLMLSSAQEYYDDHHVDTIADWQKCGGVNYVGSTTCTHENDGTKCSKVNDDYYQCMPHDGVSRYGFYNLQLYGWQIESKHFTDNYCGNRWLDYYNECGVRRYFPGGIGFCGSWGSTLRRMITCGKDEDFRSNNQTTIDRFCDCLPCEFKDAAKSTSYPYLYRSGRCDLEVPRFDEVIFNLTREVCNNRHSDCDHHHGGKTDDGNGAHNHLSSQTEVAITAGVLLPLIIIMGGCYCYIYGTPKWMHSDAKQEPLLSEPSINQNE